MRSRSPSTPSTASPCRGKVKRVRSFGESRLGDITYRVTIALDRLDTRLRWNMTASVAIEPANKR